MVLQLTDFTSEITDEELREFTSEYYIPSALHQFPKCTALGAAKITNFEVNCRLLAIFIPTVQLSARLLSESVSLGQRLGGDVLLGRCCVGSLGLCLSITQGSLPRDERSPTLGCIVWSPEDVPNVYMAMTGGGWVEMDLFSVVHLSKPKLVTEGVRPLRDGEEPLLESTVGRTMELVLEQPEAESTS
ncbi:hypothetical protein Tco_0682975 [Tanacetum coccineum]|uniref:Uncharacterized protein n=1 Tax=Tanacetum coccineum TaxID=301880 RepID=A0ABQ4XUC1_9ASTR